MTNYFPAASILPALTDEALQRQTFYAGEIAELLLTIPAEFRQAAAAEQHCRSTKTTYAPTNSGLHEARAERVRDSLETWHEVVAEIAQQVAKAGAS